MRKILLFLFFLVAFIPFDIYAEGKGDAVSDGILPAEKRKPQYDKSDFKIRHIPGEKAGAALLRYTPDGFGAEFLMTYFKRKGFYYSFVLSPLFGKVGQTNFEQVKLGFRPQKVLWDYRKNFFVSAFITPYACFENFHNSMLDKSDRGFYASIGVGAEAEYCFSNRVSVVSVFEQDFNIASDMGDYTYSIMLGARVKF